LPEHVDRDAATRVPVAADPEPCRLDQLDDAFADGNGRVLVECTRVAEACEIKLERLRLEQPDTWGVVDHEMREVRLARDWTETGEFGASEARKVRRVLVRVGNALKLGLTW